MGSFATWLSRSSATRERPAYRAGRRNRRRYQGSRPPRALTDSRSSCATWAAWASRISSSRRSRIRSIFCSGVPHPLPREKSGPLIKCNVACAILRDHQRDSPDQGRAAGRADAARHRPAACARWRLGEGLSAPAVLKVASDMETDIRASQIKRRNALPFCAVARANE